MAKLILIDGNSIGFAAQMTTRLTCGQREVQAIFQTIKMMRTLVEGRAECEFMVLWDGRAQWRFDLYPEYKSNRESNPKMLSAKLNYQEQRPDIQRALKMLDITQVTAFEAEADDLAGYFVGKSAERGLDVLLVTADRDWLQLVSPHCAWFDPIHDHRVSMKNFADFTGYATPAQFLEGKALIGDASDCIKGVGGIGEKGAPEFLLQWGSVENFFALADAGKLPKKLPIAQLRFAKNEMNKYGVPMREAFYRNMKLMDLRNAPKPAPDTVKVERGEFDAGAFYQFCEELAFQSICNNYITWIAPFVARDRLKKERKAA